jgi:hypothetical protein
MRQLMSLAILLLPAWAMLSRPALAQYDPTSGDPPFQYNFCPQEAVNSVEIRTTTADTSGAGTDGEVRFFMGSASYRPDAGGGIGRYATLDKSGYDDFEQGAYDKYVITGFDWKMKVGDITHVGFYLKDNGTAGIGWSLDRFDVYINGKLFYSRSVHWDVSGGTIKWDSFGGVLYGQLRPTIAFTQSNVPVTFSPDLLFSNGCSETFSVTAFPKHGIVSGSFPYLTYTPNPGFYGTDTVGITATGPYAPVEYPRSISSTATATINVLYANTPPVAVGDVVSTPKAQAISIPVMDNDSDPDLTSGYYVGESLSFVNISAPLHGSAQGSGHRIVYTPDPTYSGADFFIYTIADRTGASSTARVDVTVTFRNVPPAATAQTLSVKMNTPTPVTLSGTDVEGEALTYQVSRGPIHGALLGTEPHLTYISSPPFVGTDSIEFRVSDGATTSAPAQVTLNISNDTNEVAPSDLVLVDSANMVNLGIARPGQPLMILPIGNPGESWEFKGAGDFDHDGKTDLLFQTIGGSLLKYWGMDGRRMASFDTSVASGASGFTVKGVADFNKDGSPDLLFQNMQTGEIRVSFLAGSVSISDKLFGKLSLGWSVKSVGDLNNDGWPDVVCYHPTLGYALVFWDGQKAKSQRVGSFAPSLSLRAIGDGNHDGYTDLYFQNNGTGVATVWQGNSIAKKGWKNWVDMGQIPAGYQFVGTFN